MEFAQWRLKILPVYCEMPFGHTFAERANLRR
jgi:hypothetical protein